MKKKIRYTDEPIGKIEIVGDFLPPPENLILKEKNVKVTINLSESSIGFFKEVAEENHTQYQRIIRTVLDQYASKYGRERIAGDRLKKGLRRPVRQKGASKQS